MAFIKKNDKEISSILIKPFGNPKSLIKGLKKVFNQGYIIKSREELNQTYYKMLNVEGLILNILMVLILWGISTAPFNWKIPFFN